MSYLLDTSTFIWVMTEPVRLSSAATAVVQDVNNRIFVSVVSLWEIEIKASMGKMAAIPSLKDLLDHDLTYARFELLDLRREHIHNLPSLPHHHKDPFDRMLIAQAVSEGLTIITKDSYFPSYPVPVLW